MRGTFLRNERRQRSDIAVGGVLRERRSIDADHFCDAGSGEFRRHRIDRCAKRNQLEWSARLLRRGNRFPRRSIDATVTLFGNDEHHGCNTRASSRRRVTSSLAASAGEPEIIWVFLPFSGK